MCCFWTVFSNTQERMHYGADTGWKKQPSKKVRVSGLRQQTKLSTLETVAQTMYMSWKGDVGTSLITQRKETSPMRNQRNDEGRVCVTAPFIQKSQRQVTPGSKAQVQEGVGWFGSTAAPSDRRTTWSGRPGCWARGMRVNVARPLLLTLAPMLAVLWRNADLWTSLDRLV